MVSLAGLFSAFGAIFGAAVGQRSVALLECNYMDVNTFGMLPRGCTAFSACGSHSCSCSLMVAGAFGELLTQSNVPNRNLRLGRTRHVAVPLLVSPSLSFLYPMLAASVFLSASKWEEAIGGAIGGANVAGKFVVELCSSWACLGMRQTCLPPTLLLAAAVLQLALLSLSLSK